MHSVDEWSTARARGYHSRGRMSEPSPTLPNPPHPFDLLLDDLGLPDVPAGIETPGDKGEGLFGNRLRILEIGRDPDDGKGPRSRRVQMAGLLVDARIEQLRAALADAVFVDLQLLPCLWAGSISHRHHVLADGRLTREPQRRRETSLRESLTRFHEVILQYRQDVHRLRVREPDVELEQPRSVLRRHEAAVQDPFERRTASCHRGDRLVHRFEGSLEILRREELEEMVRVAVRAHPARVRALVPFVRALVIL